VTSSQAVDTLCAAAQGAHITCSIGSVRFWARVAAGAGLGSPEGGNPTGRMSWRRVASNDLTRGKSLLRPLT
jgi:hypothetical protein